MSFGFMTSSPIPGPSPYEQDQYLAFRGRECELDNLQRILDAQSLHVLLGESGVGKTSFIRAGLVPRMQFKRLSRLCGVDIKGEAPEQHAIAAVAHAALPIVLRDWAGWPRGQTADLAAFSRWILQQIDCALESNRDFVEGIGLQAQIETALADARRQTIPPAACTESAAATLEIAMLTSARARIEDALGDAASLRDVALAINGIAEAAGPPLIILDQFEEVLLNEALRESALALIESLHLSRTPRVLVSMRRDFSHLLQPLEAQEILVGSARFTVLGELRPEAFNDALVEAGTEWGFLEATGAANALVGGISEQFRQAEGRLAGTLSTWAFISRETEDVPSKAECDAQVTESGCFEESPIVALDQSAVHRAAGATPLRDWIDSSIKAVGPNRPRTLTWCAEGHTAPYRLFRTDSCKALIDFVLRGTAPSANSDTIETMFTRVLDNARVESGRYYYACVDCSGRLVGAGMHRIRAHERPQVPEFLKSRFSLESYEDFLWASCRRFGRTLLALAVDDLAPGTGTDVGIKRAVSLASLSRVHIGRRLETMDQHLLNRTAAWIAADSPLSLNQSGVDVAEDTNREFLRLALEHVLGAVLDALSIDLVLKRHDTPSGNAYELVHDQLAPALRSWAQSYSQSWAYWLTQPFALQGRIIDGDSLRGATGKIVSFRTALASVHSQSAPKDSAEGGTLSLGGMTWDSCIVRGCDFMDVLFDDCWFKRTLFDSCSFGSGSPSSDPSKTAGFTDCHLDEVALQNCDLRNVGVRITPRSGAQHDDERLRPAMRRATILGTTSLEADEGRASLMQNVLFKGAGVSGVERLQLDNLDLQTTLLENVKFENCWMPGCVFFTARNGIEDNCIRRKGISRGRGTPDIGAPALEFTSSFLVGSQFQDINFLGSPFNVTCCDCRGTVFNDLMWADALRTTREITGVRLKAPLGPHANLATHIPARALLPRLRREGDGWCFRLPVSYLSASSPHESMAGATFGSNGQYVRAWLPDSDLVEIDTDKTRKSFSGCALGGAVLRDSLLGTVEFVASPETSVDSTPPVPGLQRKTRRASADMILVDEVRLCGTTSFTGESSQSYDVGGGRWKGVVLEGGELSFAKCSVAGSSFDTSIEAPGLGVLRFDQTQLRNCSGLLVPSTDDTPKPSLREYVHWADDESGEGQRKMWAGYLTAEHKAAMELPPTYEPTS